MAVDSAVRTKVMHHLIPKLVKDISLRKVRWDKINKASREGFRAVWTAIVRSSLLSCSSKAVWVVRRAELGDAGTEEGVDITELWAFESSRVPYMHSNDPDEGTGKLIELFHATNTLSKIQAEPRYDVVLPAETLCC